MSEQRICDRCHREDRTCPVVFVQIVGVLMIVVRQAYGGNLCRECTRKLYYKTLGVNLTLGWLWGLSIIVNPIVLIQNAARYRKARRVVAGIKVDQTKRDSPPLASQAMTWQATLIVLLCIPFLILGVLAQITGANAHIDPAGAAFMRSWGVGILLAIVAAIGWLAFSHHRRVYRVDLAPDILAALFDPACIYQAGNAHVAVLGTRQGSYVRILVLAQNRYASPSDFRLLSGKYRRRFLSIPLPAAAVALGWCDVPIVEYRNGHKFEVQLYPLATDARGKAVRFALRQVPTTREHESLLVVAQAMGGHLHVPLDSPGPKAGQGLYRLSRDSMLSIPLEDDGPELKGGVGANITERQVQLEILWSPEQPRSMEEITACMAAALAADSPLEAAGAGLYGIVYMLKKRFLAHFAIYPRRNRQGRSIRDMAAA